MMKKDLDSFLLALLDNNNGNELINHLGNVHGDIKSSRAIISLRSSLEPAIVNVAVKIIEKNEIFFSSKDINNAESIKCYYWDIPQFIDFLHEKKNENLLNNSRLLKNYGAPAAQKLRDEGLRVLSELQPHAGRPGLPTGDAAVLYYEDYKHAPFKLLLTLDERQLRNNSLLYPATICIKLAQPGETINYRHLYVDIPVKDWHRYPVLTQYEPFKIFKAQHQELSDSQFIDYIASYARQFSSSSMNHETALKKLQLHLDARTQGVEQLIEELKDISPAMMALHLSQTLEEKHSSPPHQKNKI